MRKQRPNRSLQIPSMHAWHQQLIDRRLVLKRLAGGILMGFLPWVSQARENEATSPDPWPTIESVLQHLFPSEPDAPGAREINALNYLRSVIELAGAGTEEHDFILQGAQWLEEIALEDHQEVFSQLDFSAKERVLRRVAASEVGENWISTLLYYLFEALLADPVYGGNPNGIGWKWLQHIPGFPRPSPEKTYRRLGS